MSRHAFLLTVALVSCASPIAGIASPAAVPSEPSATAVTPSTEAQTGAEPCPDGSMPVPTRFRRNTPRTGPDGCAMPQPTIAPQLARFHELPMPHVDVKRIAFPVSARPALVRLPTSVFPANAIDGYGVSLMGFLDRTRGAGSYVTGSFDEREWDSRVWPGPFQDHAKTVTRAKPYTGRFFHLESMTIDAVYALPWAIPQPNMSDSLQSRFQFIEATLKFRDHAETPPAEGELWYTWHVRLPTAGASVFAIADGYDERTAKTWMNADVDYWPRSLLETEGASAVAAYLWTESFEPDTGSRGPGANDTTPFWKERFAALSRLNDLFNTGALAKRLFEGVTVRIDRFEPMTYFGGGVVTVTVTGRLVEVLNGKTFSETFSQPLKFFRFGGNGVNMSGWIAVDAEEDGVWISGGNLALDKLQTAHG